MPRTRRTGRRRVGLGLWRGAAAVVVAAVAAVVVLAASAAPASAHAILLLSEPADSAILASPPRQLQLSFSEAVEIDRSSFQLVDGDGRREDLTARAVSPPDHDPGSHSRMEVVIGLPDLALNTYRVNYRVLASDDLHESNGYLVFGVGRPVVARPASSRAPVPPPAEVALRWAGLAALAGLVGGLCLAWLARQQAAAAADALRATALRRRLLSMSLACGAAAIVVSVALLFKQAAGSGGGGPGEVRRILLHTRFGARWLVGEAALGLLVLAVAAMRKADPRSSRFSVARVAVLPLVAVLFVARALIGHAGSANNGPLRVAVGAVHSMAATAWIGSVLAMVVVIVPLLRRGGDEAFLARRTITGFGKLGLACVAALAVTGVLLAGQQVASLDALLRTLYGRALMTKILAASVAASLGLFNAAAIHDQVRGALARLGRRSPAPAAVGRRLPRRIVLEGIVATSALLFAAVLGSAQPARGPEFAPRVKEVANPPILSTTADDLVVTLTVKPNRPGRNFVSFGVFDTRKPSPSPIGGVSVRLQEPGRAATPFTAIPVGRGQFQAISDEITTSGRLPVRIAISREGLPDAEVSFPWVVKASLAPPRQPVLVSDRPLAPILDRLGAALAALVVVGTAVALTLRRRRARVQPPVGSGQDGAAGGGFRAPEGAVLGDAEGLGDSRGRAGLDRSPDERLERATFNGLSYLGADPGADGDGAAGSAGLDHTPEAGPARHGRRNPGPLVARLRCGLRDRAWRAGGPGASAPVRPGDGVDDRSAGGEQRRT